MYQLFEIAMGAGFVAAGLYLGRYWVDTAHQSNAMNIAEHSFYGALASFFITSGLNCVWNVVYPLVQNTCQTAHRQYRRLTIYYERHRNQGNVDIDENGHLLANHRINYMV